MAKHYTYMLECADKSIYTGYTTNLTARIQKHNEGKGAKYTKIRRPVSLKYYEIYETKSEALKREYAIKQLTRQQKLALIEER
ncbi:MULTISPECIES: GIY-YIG nuclease family protein [unclassified Staphylococcus]|uniref:GIY-YIG nuclease family protein n=1 Tax=unclassified Staphylococcus TaxID=91994 RepID=UPI0021CF0A92|nr:MULTISPECIES: GIY-YIG nuclease family protein [unclassified Staphylococcus]UXR69755.1 GIY-YIG nuclease family protein [Staphylococcus sp. IVB6246]UXR71791.1 GIY-YIG nuclease family protein [Staphylococcus sp. IVB6240]UXR74097.1 GIY-YIG nuclease family protein [Staphylococcus sp. IVB6238]UXR76487.1 GIY-YIG nuclease family protein [Staphylococcus sp. IVB6233]UXR80614.1 GIY-YIG nuclease family protein [Staphylococcus sp. IVB6218]